MIIDLIHINNINNNNNKEQQDNINITTPTNNMLLNPTPIIIRPNRKPPFHHSNIPIQKLTKMRIDKWEPYLNLIYQDQNKEEKKLKNNILDGIRNGVNIDFEGERNINRKCNNLKSATQNENIIQQVDAIINEDITTNKKAGPFLTPPFPYFSYSPIGAVPKHGSWEKIRVIHHLSYPFHGDSINASTQEEKIKLGNFDQAANAIKNLGADCYLIKLDVEAAYKQVPVRKEDWHLLGLKWKGKYYYERVLPFGLKSSCRLWELYATALHKILEKILKNVTIIIHYIDDFLFVVKLQSDAELALKQALEICNELGIPMAQDKVEGPCHKLIFLGIQICTQTMTASLDNIKLFQLQQLLNEWENKKTSSLQQLQSLIGKLNWVCSVVRPGRVFLRRIIDESIRISKLNSNRKSQHSLQGNIYQDIIWWKNLIAPPWNGISLLYDIHWIKSIDEQINLTTDACTIGYGSVMGKEWFYGQWSDPQLDLAKRKKKLSMPFLELYVLVLAAVAWGNRWKCKKIIFHTDCLPLVIAFKKRGTSKNSKMAALYRYLSTLAFHHNFDFKLEHISGVTNIASDLLSRNNLFSFHQQFPHVNPLPIHPHPILPMIQDM